MQPGKLNRLVSLTRPGTTQDELGQPVPGWTLVAKVWANIRYLNGVETIKAGQPGSVTKVSIRIRRRTDINAGMRVEHEGTVFEIKSPLPDEESRERLDLSCEVINVQG
jgi:SPP1 family predicted phage head-tail adaptor